MRRLRKVDPLIGLASLLLALAVAVFAVTRFTDALDRWVPDVVTELVGIAFTISVIDLLIRKREKARVRPYVEHVIAEVRPSFFGFVTFMLLDYVTTHVFPETLPPNSLDLLDRWLANQHQENASRRVDQSGEGVTVIWAGRRLLDGVFAPVENNRHDLNPELWLAVQQLHGAVSHAEWLSDMQGDQFKIDGVGNDAAVNRPIVEAARRVGAELARYDSEAGSFTIEESWIKAADTVRRAVLFGEAARP